MSIPFLKMHGAGNDFVVLDGRESPPNLTPAIVRRMADRSVGIGCDQLIIIEQDPEGADAFMRILNSDGTEAGACGNPHATYFVDDLQLLPIESIGPVLEKNRIFPERANIGFALIESPERIRLRVWERGAGLTLACGSGACAALVNAHRRGLTGRRATVVADGGELVITWREDNHVLMRGPAVTVFAGAWMEAG